MRLSQLTAVLCLLFGGIVFGDLIALGQELSPAKEITPPTKKSDITELRNQVEKLSQEVAELRKRIDGVSPKLDTLTELPNPAGPEPVSKDLLYRLEGHKGTVQAVAISPDGKFGASTGDDGTIRLWDLATGKESWVKNYLKGQITGVAFSADGELLLAANSGISAIIKVKDGGLLMSMGGIGGPMAFGPQISQKLMTGRGKITYWKNESNTTKTFDVKMDFLRTVGFSSDGKLAICAGGFTNKAEPPTDSMVRVWNLETGEVLFRIDLPVRTYFSGAHILPGNREVITVGPDSRIRVWDMASGKELRKFDWQTSPHSLAISCDGSRAVSGGHESVDVWNVATGDRLSSFPVRPTAECPVAMSRDSRFVLSSGRDGIVRYWKVPEPSVSKSAVEQAQQPLPERVPAPGEVRNFKGNDSSAYGLAVTPDGKHLLTSSSDCTVRLWDLATGAELKRKPSNGKGADIVNHIDVSRDGRWAALACGQTRGTQQLEIWDLQEWQPVKNWQTHDHALRMAVFSPDAHYVASTSIDGTARLWNVKTMQEVRRFGAKPAEVSAVAFAPDGNSVVTAGGDGVARLWDVDSGEEVRKFNQAGAISGLAFTADGKQLLTSGFSLSLWDVAKGEKIRTWQDMQRPIQITAFAAAPNGKIFATAGDEGRIQIWGLDQGSPIHELAGHDSLVNRLVFTSDSQQIVSSGQDRTIRLWNLNQQPIAPPPAAKPQPMSE